MARCTRLAIEDLMVLMAQVSPLRLELAHLQDWMSRLHLPDSLLRAHTRFSSDSYCRSLICRTHRFDLLLLGWQPGQSSTIHDHTDSLNVTQVYRGQLTARLFGSAPQLALQQQDQLESGDLATVDRQQIHQLANTATQPLVTLHLYARPLEQIRVYRSGSAQPETLAVQHQWHEVAA